MQLRRQSTAFSEEVSLLRSLPHALVVLCLGHESFPPGVPGEPEAQTQSWHVKRARDNRGTRVTTPSLCTTSFHL